MMADPALGHWLFVVRTEDRPGAAAALAVVFSGRGIQLESMVGAGDVRHPAGAGEGTICLTFQAFASRKDMVRRVLERLEVVRSVEEYDYDQDPCLVKAGALRLRRWSDEAATALQEPGVACQRLDESAADTLVAVSGSPPAVDRTIGRLSACGVLAGAACALLPPVRPAQAECPAEGADPASRT